MPRHVQHAVTLVDSFLAQVQAPPLRGTLWVSGMFLPPALPNPRTSTELREQ